ncbi:MAG: response regulator transcription factor [Ruminococcus sp.]|nr:response regulator transcription factor [Ruminococcus sp.]
MEKLSIIICDDEENVRQGLRMMIPWRELGFEIIGEAENGDEGFEIISEKRPDIVITDIRMPGRTGLEMLADLKNADIKVKSVILTGYSDFEYARTAVAIGVKQFILKPLEEEELIGVLKELRSEILREREGRILRDAGEKAAHDDMISGLFMGVSDTESIPEKLSLKSNNYIVALVELPLTDDPFAFSEGIYAVRLGVDGAVGLLFDGYSEEEAEKALEENTDSSNFAAMSETVHSLRDVKEAYNSAKMLYDMKFIFLKCGIMTPSRFKTYWKYDGDTSEIAASVFAYIEINSAERITEKTDELRLILSDGKYAPEAIKLICMDTVTDAVRRVRGNVRNPSGLPTPDEISALAKLPCLYDIIAEMTDMLVKISDSNYGNTTRSNIEKVVDYINHNFQKELRLEYLAQIFGYNSAYLGKVFTRHTGENFNNYLDRIRITEAKRLLETDNYKVYEVAEMVGFSNINYFHNKFKKMVGISPLAYKKGS